MPNRASARVVGGGEPAQQGRTCSASWLSYIAPAALTGRQAGRQAARCESRTGKAPLEQLASPPHSAPQQMVPAGNTCCTAACTTADRPATWEPRPGRRPEPRWWPLPVPECPPQQGRDATGDVVHKPRPAFRGRLHPWLHLLQVVGRDSGSVRNAGAASCGPLMQPGGLPAQHALETSSSCFC